MLVSLWPWTHSEQPCVRLRFFLVNNFRGIMAKFCSLKLPKQWDWVILAKLSKFKQVCEIRFCTYSVKPILRLRMIKLEVENLVTLSLKKNSSQRRSRKKLCLNTHFFFRKTPLEGMLHPSLQNTPVCNDTPPSAPKHPCL